MSGAARENGGWSATSAGRLSYVLYMYVCSGPENRIAGVVNERVREHVGCVGVRVRSQ